MVQFYEEVAEALQEEEAQRLREEERRNVSTKKRRDDLQDVRTRLRTEVLGYARGLSREVSTILRSELDTIRMRTERHEQAQAESLSDLTDLVSGLSKLQRKTAEMKTVGEEVSELQRQQRMDLWEELQTMPGLEDAVSIIEIGRNAMESLGRNVKAVVTLGSAQSKRGGGTWGDA